MPINTPTDSRSLEEKIENSQKMLQIISDQVEQKKNELTSIQYVTGESKKEKEAFDAKVLALTDQKEGLQIDIKNLEGAIEGLVEQVAQAKNENEVTMKSSEEHRTATAERNAELAKREAALETMGGDLEKKSKELAERERVVLEKETFLKTVIDNLQ